MVSRSTMTNRTPIAERFWAKVNKVSPNDCWEWTAGLTSVGYGLITAGRAGRGHILAHRLSFELANGPIPKGLFVCHSCDNRKCVNPAHLFLGTNRDNMDDKVSKNRHLRGSQFPQAVLKESDIPEIKRLRRAGLSYREIGRRFGIAHSSIIKIVKNQAWVHAT